MLNEAFKQYPNLEGLIIHSDQGWQYQHDFYHHFLEDKGIQQSMSRKGNSPDNGMMESFFGILKSEMFYGYEKTFKSIEHLEQAIIDYINYYNNKRIKINLKPQRQLLLANLVTFVDFTLPIKSMLLSVLTSDTMNLETF